MALIVADRVQETTTVTGTGAASLGGAVTGYRTFGSVMASGDTAYYTIDGGAEWEVGLGTYSPGSIARTSVIASSNGNAAVNFSAGNKKIFIAGVAAQVGDTGSGAVSSHVAQPDPHPQYTTAAEADAAASAAVATHVAQADPHPQYTTSAEATSAANAAVATHEAAADPHPQYTTAAEATAAANSAVATHEAAADPHPQYNTAAETTTQINSALTAATADAAPPAVAAAGALGTSTQFSREDHTHQGVTSISVNGGAAQSGPVSISTTPADIPVVLANATAAAETIIARFQLPANFFAVANDAARVVVAFHSGATAGTHTLRVRYGTAGTTADALIATIGATASVVANSYCEAQLLVMTPTVGAAGTMRAQGFHRFTATLTSNAAAALAAAVAANTTVGAFLSISIQPSAASATAATQGAYIQKSL